jgi:hypothetical protein
MLVESNDRFLSTIKWISTVLIFTFQELKVVNMAEKVHYINNLQKNVFSIHMSRKISVLAERRPIRCGVCRT